LILWRPGFAQHYADGRPRALTMLKSIGRMPAASDNTELQAMMISIGRGVPSARRPYSWVAAAPRKCWRKTDAECELRKRIGNVESRFDRRYGGEKNVNR
jgi:hypothetical protein